MYRTVEVFRIKLLRSQWLSVDERIGAGKAGHCRHVQVLFCLVKGNNNKKKGRVSEKSMSTTATKITKKTSKKKINRKNENNVNECRKVPVRSRIDPGVEVVVEVVKAQLSC